MGNTNNLPVDHNKVQYDELFGEFKPGKIRINNELIDFTSDDLVEGNVLGTGSMNYTIEVTYEPKNLVLAAKVETLPVKIKKESIEDIIREIAVLQKCDIPEIVTYFGMLIEKQECMILMEIMDKNLYDLYKEVSNKTEFWFDERALSIIAMTLLKALNYLKEEHRVMYRDVKPQNILIKRSGEIKLCDFGVSKVFENNKSTSPTQTVGTEVYRAPERFTGVDETTGFDVRSDVWSIGITLFETATYKHPFQDYACILKLARRIINDDPPKLTIEDCSKNHYSEEIMNFINRCLIKKVNDRPYIKDLVKEPFYLRHISAEDNLMYMKNFFTRYI